MLLRRRSEGSLAKISERSRIAGAPAAYESLPQSAERRPSSPKRLKLFKRLARVYQEASLEGGEKREHLAIAHPELKDGALTSPSGLKEERVYPSPEADESPLWALSVWESEL